MKLPFAFAALILILTGCAERTPLEPHRPPGNYPQIGRLTAHPMTVHPGEAVLLHWDARNTPKVTLDQAIDPRAGIRAEFESLGTFPASGSLRVQPKKSTTYVVSCGNEIIGCSSASVHVVVQ